MILFPLLLIFLVIGVMLIFKQGRTFYNATVANALIVSLLVVRFRKKILVISLILLLGSMTFYDLAVGLTVIGWFKSVPGPQSWADIYSDPNFFYMVVLLSIYLGILASSIFCMGLLNKHRRFLESNIRQILAIASFLSFIIAIVLLYIAKEGEIDFLYFVLPTGSWIVPILSYFYSKLPYVEKNQQENLSIAFCGLIFSFALGFIFAILTFGVPASIGYQIHPAFYPFMASSWLVIASYILLLDTEAWNPTDILKWLREEISMPFQLKSYSFWLYILCLVALVLILLLS